METKPKKTYPSWVRKKRKEKRQRPTQITDDKIRRGTGNGNRNQFGLALRCSPIPRWGREDKARQRQDIQTQGKTKVNKSRQDKARGKTRQDNNRQNSTRKHMTKQDKATQGNNARQHRTRQSKVMQGKARHGKTATKSADDVLPPPPNPPSPFRV